MNLALSVNLGGGQLGRYSRESTGPVVKGKGEDITHIVLDMTPPKMTPPPGLVSPQLTVNQTWMQSACWDIRMSFLWPKCIRMTCISKYREKLSCIELLSVVEIPTNSICLGPLTDMSRVARKSLIGCAIALANFKVVHNNCPRGILLNAIVTLKSMVSQRFSAVWKGLNRRTDPY